MALFIDQVLPEVGRRLSEGRHVVLTAPPGAGKTTAVPLALLDAPWLKGQRILMLEPRRLAARASAHRMAALLGEPIGARVGYRIRFETRVSDRTRLEVVTEGILTRLVQHDPSLTGIGLVIFDEFHERSLHADLGLALTLDAHRVFRPDLRMLVMSATLDVAGVAALLGDASTIVCEGRLHPVETQYLDRPLSVPLEAAIADRVKASLRHHSGNVLVFLPGMAEIRRVERHLTAAALPSHVVVAPLHGALSQAAQDLALAMPAPGQRKVVLSSAVAETSLTIEGVETVIDSGLMRVPRYDARLGFTRLRTIRVTRDSADQRRGRAGRLGPGVCHRMWTAAEQQALLPRRPPEILESDLASLVLELAVWGTVDPGHLSWLDPPPRLAVEQAKDLLRRLRAIDADGRATAEGRRLAELPLHPRLSHMIVRAIPRDLGPMACEVAALLGDRDLLRGPPGWRNADLRIRLDALHQGSVNEPGVSVDRGALRRLEQAVEQIKQVWHREFQAGAAGGPARDRPVSDPIDRLGLVLAFAYPDRVAQRQPGGEGRYLLTSGRGARFSGPEPLSNEPYLVIAALAGGDEVERVELAAPIAVDDLEQVCAEEVADHEVVEWDRQSKSVLAGRERRLGALVLQRRPLIQPNPGLLVSAVLDGIRHEGLSCLPWTAELRQWRARVRFLRRAQDGGWPDLGDEALLRTLDQWLAPFVGGLMRLEEVQRLDLAGPLCALLTWEQRRALDRLAPTHLIVPSGSRIRLNYDGDVPVLSVRLQEMFGCRETPRIMDGAVPVMVHLLSPAGRPVQVTQDLGSFWATGYHDVRKELRGRYPKHHWPENPLQAEPTRRTKSGLGR